MLVLVLEKDYILDVIGLLLNVFIWMIGRLFHADIDNEDFVVTKDNAYDNNNRRWLWMWMYELARTHKDEWSSNAGTNIERLL